MSTPRLGLSRGHSALKKNNGKHFPDIFIFLKWKDFLITSLQLQSDWTDMQQLAAWDFEGLFLFRAAQSYFFTCNSWHTKGKKERKKEFAMIIWMTVTASLYGLLKSVWTEIAHRISHAGCSYTFSCKYIMLKSCKQCNNSKACWCHIFPN